MRTQLLIFEFLQGIEGEMMIGGTNSEGEWEYSDEDGRPCCGAHGTYANWGPGSPGRVGNDYIRMNPSTGMWVDYDGIDAEGVVCY